MRLLPMRSRSGRDEGSLTITAAVVMAGLLVIGVLGVQFAAAVSARHQAEAAADLGALAGAARVPEGVTVACARAAEAVQRNRARIDQCALDGLDLLVTVWVEVNVGPVSGSAQARARAGP